MDVNTNCNSLAPSKKDELEVYVTSSKNKLNKLNVYHLNYDEVQDLFFL